MENIFVWLAVFVGALFAFYIDGLVRSKYKAPERTKNEEAIVPDNKILLIVASLSAVIGWVWVATIMILVILYNGFSVEVKITGDQFMASAYVFIVLSLVFLVGVMKLKCSQCNKRLIAQYGKYENETKQFQPWAKVVVNCLFRRKLQCMHCGQKYIV